MLDTFGFGKKTGVDLLNESEGLLPSVEWKRARGQPWYPGETVITGIGQGAILATPLQLAVATAALANHGVRQKPHSVEFVVRVGFDKRFSCRLKFLSKVFHGYEACAYRLRGRVPGRAG